MKFQYSRSVTHKTHNLLDVNQMKLVQKITIWKWIILYVVNECKLIKLDSEQLKWSECNTIANAFRSIRIKDIIQLYHPLQLQTKLECTVQFVQKNSSESACRLYADEQARYINIQKSFSFKIMNELMLQSKIFLE